MKKINKKFTTLLISTMLIFLVVLNVNNNTCFAALADDYYSIIRKKWNEVDVNRFGEIKTTKDEDKSDNYYAIDVSNELKCLKQILLENDPKFRESMIDGSASLEDVQNWLKRANKYVDNPGFSILQKLIDEKKVTSTDLDDVNDALYFMRELRDNVNEINEVYRDKINSETDGTTGEIIDDIVDKSDEIADVGEKIDKDRDDEINGVTKEASEIADSLGGILLRPIFAIVNAIADSVMRVTGEVMFPEAYGNGIGTADIMVSSPIDLSYDVNKSIKVEIDVSNYKALSGKYYPQIRYTPEEIFSGQVNILSIDFISGKDSEGNNIDNEGWVALRKIIAKWYQALRLIAVIGLLSVLIYTGIKIMLSSTAKDKAKYKEWIVNWFIAVALLFSMHYIMSFIITVNSEISNLLYISSSGITVVPTGSNTKIQTFTTNLIGLVRFHILEESFTAKVAYEIMYIALIAYTLKFTFVYLKRVLNMAFLTLIAPIVALTYPIDKLNDGRAQGFEMWLKEYIFNALLQILHYLLYYILISSSIELAANNPIYAIVALGFMNEAERLLKKIFGFDKASGGTVGGMSALTAATVVSSFKGIGKIGKGPGGNGSGGKDNNKINDFKPNTVDGIKGLQVDSNAVVPSPANVSSSGNGQQLPNVEGAKSNVNSQSVPNNDEIEDYTWQYLNGEDMNQNDKNPPNIQLESSQEQPSGIQTPTIPISNPSIAQPSTTPIHEMAESKNVGKLGKLKNGMANVGKQLAKPVWDFDKSNAENGKRLARNIGRGALGAGMGVAAAAVQAGISITDGKYNPLEAVGAFSAGYAGGGVVSNKVAGVGQTFMEGYNMGDEEAQRKKAVEDFKNRDDVIAAFKKKYGNDWKEKRERAANNYYAYGETNVSQMMKRMDKADKLMKNNNETQGNKKWDTDMADTQMRNIEKARKELKDMNMYGKIMNDNEAAEKFVQSQVKNGIDEAKVRTLISQMKQTK